MKNTLTFIFAFLALLMLYYSYKANRQLQAKDQRIKDLDFQVWSLKLDKHLDSISDHYVDAFKKKMDSLAGR